MYFSARPFVLSSEDCWNLCKRKPRQADVHTQGNMGSPQAVSRPPSAKVEVKVFEDELKAVQGVALKRVQYHQYLHPNTCFVQLHADGIVTHAHARANGRGRVTSDFEARFQNQTPNTPLNLQLGVQEAGKES